MSGPQRPPDVEVLNEFESHPQEVRPITSRSTYSIVEPVQQPNDSERNNDRDPDRQELEVGYFRLRSAAQPIGVQRSAVALAVGATPQKSQQRNPTGIENLQSTILSFQFLLDRNRTSDPVHFG